MEASFSLPEKGNTNMEKDNAKMKMDPVKQEWIGGISKNVWLLIYTEIETEIDVCVYVHVFPFSVQGEDLEAMNTASFQLLVYKHSTKRNQTFLEKWWFQGLGG